MNFWKMACLLLIPNSLLAVYAQQWVLHVYAVREAMELVLSDLKDGETSFRGYSLTGDPKFLKPYQECVVNAPKRVKRLRRLVADNPPQVARVDALKGLVDGKIEILREGVDAKRDNDQKRLEAATFGGKTRMDAVRDQIATMTAVEEQLLAGRVQKFRMAYWWMIAVIGVVMAGVAVSIFRTLRHALGYTEYFVNVENV